MLEQTIVFIDNISLKRSITGKIIDILLRTDLNIIGIKMIAPDKEFIKDFCSISRSKMSKDYVKYSYLDKRIMAIVFQGDDAIEKVKNIVGRERKMMKKEFWHGTTLRGIYFAGSRKANPINPFSRVYENVAQIPYSRMEAYRMIKLVWKNHRDNGISLRHLREHPIKENEERTFIMLKPETIDYRLIGKVIDDLSKSGLYIMGAKIVRPTKEQFQQHYINLLERGEKLYNEVVNHMSGYEKGKKVKDNKVLHLVYQGPKGEVTKVIRDILGATNPENAAIGTIRRSYGKNITANVVHASATKEDTERELAIWDTPNELIEPIIEYKPKIFEKF